MNKHIHRPLHPFWQRTLATCLAVGFGLVSAIEPAIRSAAAQTAAPTSVPGQPDEGRLDQAKLEQLLAPVALYPDTLLAMMFMASTYPLEVVQAERWLGRDGNAKLKGDGLAKALEKQPWDDSVKSLTAIPDVLKMMADQLEWTQQVGDAVLAQQQDVLNAVQVLRSRAQKAGKLESGPQQTVNITQNTAAVVSPAGPSGSGYVVPPPQEIIVIAPTQPEQIYVPVYNPSVVYGGWPYPASPPYYYPPPAGYAVGSALLTGMAFVGTAALVGSAWGWARPAWGGGNINVNRNINNNVTVNRNQMAVAGNNWQHNTAHRQGVAYNNQGVRNQYQPNRGAQNASREEFRGRTQQVQAGGARPGAGTPGAAAGARPGVGGAGAAAGARPGGAGPVGGGPGAAGQRANVQRPQQGAAGAAGNRPAAGAGSGFGGGQAASGRPSVGAPPGGRQPGGGGPQGFQGIGQGGNARAAGQRGQVSRQSQPSPSIGQANRGGGGAQARGGGGGARGGGGGGGARGGGGGGRGGR